MTGKNSGEAETPVFGLIKLPMSAASELKLVSVKLSAVGTPEKPMGTPPLVNATPARVPSSLPVSPEVGKLVWAL